MTDHIWADIYGVSDDKYRLPPELRRGSKNWRVGK
jgi:hypothetical protein